jgi:hypothetical protein
VAHTFSRSAQAIAALALSTLPFGLAFAAGNAAAIAAAQKTAQSGGHCAALGAFYWEIGDGSGVIVSGANGSDYKAETTMQIFSASKWVWGAFAVQKLGELNAEQIAALEMTSGYTSQNPLPCLFTRTIGACQSARSNGVQTQDHVGHFFYNGGHDQKMAVDMGLGNNGPVEMTATVFGTLGRDINLHYKHAQPAGGLEGTPAGYASFLRKIIKGELKMHDFLGSHPVCTLKDACPGALFSPVKEAWHYSLNHWIEDAPGIGDGAYSSPGLAGFYPWISADKKVYGIVAREKQGGSSYWDSVLCGRDIRKAYLSSSPVP